MRAAWHNGIAHSFTTAFFHCASSSSLL
jgi:hypothetical protein